jgi:preprotein translocase subunit SecA
MLSIFKKLFGDKATRDLKEVMPLVKEIQDVYGSIEKLSNDELRLKTIEFREKISSYLKEEITQIEDLKKQAEAYDLDMDEKEKLFNRIDELEKIQYDKTENILLEILPEAFSVVKETARRFKENEVVEVTAKDFDRELAAHASKYRGERRQSLLQK